MARTRALNYLEKRDVILHRSAQLFARHDYTGTSISMIAGACGVSKALLFDILHAHLSDLVERVAAVVSASAAGEARLLAIGEVLLEVNRHSRAEHQVQLANLQLLPEDRLA